MIILKGKIWTKQINTQIYMINLKGNIWTKQIKDQMYTQSVKQPNSN